MYILLLSSCCYSSDSPNGRISPSKALMVSTLSRAITAITFLPITVVKARYEVWYIHVHAGFCLQWLTGSGN